MTFGEGTRGIFMILIFIYNKDQVAKSLRGSESSTRLADMWILRVPYRRFIESRSYPRVVAYQQSSVAVGSSRRPPRKQGRPTDHFPNPPSAAQFALPGSYSRPRSLPSPEETWSAETCSFIAWRS